MAPLEMVRGPSEGNSDAKPLPKDWGKYVCE